MESEEQYLPEDKDLLIAISNIGISNTDNTSGNKTNRLTVIQIKATLRNRKTAHDLDESTTRYSKILIGFAFAQIIFAVLEFLFNATTSPHPILGDIILGFGLVFMIWIINDIAPRKDETKKQ